MAVSIASDATVQLRSGLYLLPQGDDEIFVRSGSRAAFSKVIRDEERRRILTRLIQETPQAANPTEIAERLGADVETVRLLVERLINEGVLETAASQRVHTIVLIGAGNMRDSVLRMLSVMDGLIVQEIAPVEFLDGLADEVLGGDAAVAVVATDRLYPRLNHATNELALELGFPVLYLYADGPEVQIGPLVQPGESACYSCFEVQDEGARHLRDEFLVFKDDLDRQNQLMVTSPLVAAMGAAWAGIALADFFHQPASRFRERVLRVETERLEVASHRILQMPRCPSCSRWRPELQHTFL
jgi:bacteriocin biosynthesis cyclodehydratase domain